MPSSPPLASSPPSGLKAALFTAPAWPLSGGEAGRRPATSHSRSAPPEPATATVCPSGLAARLSTGTPTSRGAPRGLPVRASHARTVPSTSAETIVSADGSATVRTQVLWPRRGRLTAPGGRTFQSCTVPASPPLASTPPRGLKATVRTPEARSGSSDCAGHVRHEHARAAAG